MTHSRFNALKIVYFLHIDYSLWRRRRTKR